ncbi:MAG: T9SS type A sorting domain-containing protein [Ignavibacteriales bacterium]|nr:T9SS type A sorting domain-containing protein [Ignavibacteriales bacterium]
MWTVKKAQAFQKYVVRVKVTDGVYYAETSAVVSVGGNIIADTFTDVELSSNLPNEFMLYQNYPNPFNPSTTIEYTIPSVETGYIPSLHHVTLKIYDILGREVAVLVNEEQMPGKHSVIFNVEANRRFALQSGIYFYTLQTDYFSQTKKMILTK